MDESTEEWRPVVGYEGFYEVSNRGRIRSVDRVITDSNGFPRHWRGTVLRQGTQIKGGYKRVVFSQLNRRREALVHVVVATAFHGPKPAGKEVRHLDGNPANNVPENVIWGTRAENASDTLRHGHHYQASKTHCPQGHAYSSENTKHRRNSRECRACDYAGKYVRYRPGRDRRQVADEFYLSNGGTFD